MGISPRQYADAHRQARLKTALKTDTTATQALYDAGYTATSLYTHADAILGMTPVRYQQGGTMATIHYTITPCDLGDASSGDDPTGDMSHQFGR